MNRKKIFGRFAVTILLILTVASCAFAADIAAEVRRLNKEAPSLDGFGGAEALIWLKNHDYKMLADGAMEEHALQILMVGERVPDEWKEFRIPVPSDGEFEIVEAAWYNPMLVVKEGNLDVREELLAGGAKTYVVETPDDAVGRVVVFATRTTYPRRFGADAMILLADELPIWEQNVTVEVPGALDLIWEGRYVKEPSIRKYDDGKSEYKWNIMNQEPWHGEGFVEFKRPFVAFSFKRGILQSLSEMDDYARMFSRVPLPAVASGADKSKAGTRLMEWLAEPSRTLEGYSKGYSRAPEEIPANGPWTPREQTLLLNQWLRKLGWDSRVWWQALTDLNDESPATKDLWAAPVLEVTTPANKKVWYQAGQTSDFGVTAPSVAGSTLYTRGESTYQKQTISAGSASSHKLALLWVLNLAETGVAEGTLTIDVSGGWTDLMSGGKLPSKEGLSDFIRRRINFALSGMVLTPTRVTSTRTGYKLEFDVRCAPGIVHGDSMLLRLPGSIPSRVGEMIGRESSYTFRFPFIIDQKVRMKMPPKYRLLQAPPLKNIGDGTKAVLKESITHWPKKAELIADSTWVVKTREVDEMLAMILREELAASLRWPVLDLPFRK
ncbi:hypothetical protein LJC40_00280 [Synergistaceae bacterium OttesenSCG-928-D05]|nr:hypothetical protein [Synergistaceae bacterium OttesenSCG-928-D05]